MLTMTKQVLSMSYTYDTDTKLGIHLLCKRKGVLLFEICRKRCKRRFCQLNL